MTKKLFTLLTALVLSMGIGWAASAPTKMTTLWKWTDANTNGCSYQGTGSSNSNKVYRYQFSDKLLLWFVFDDTNAPSYTFNNFTIKVPTKGDYTFSTKKTNNTLFQYPTTFSGASKYCMYVTDQTWALYSGTVKVEEGADGPYIHGSNLYVTGGVTNSRGQYVTYSGYSFAWDDEADRFVILEGDNIAYKDTTYPSNFSSS